MNKQVRLICDKPLLVQGIAISIIMIVSCVSMIVLIGIEGVVEDSREVLSMQIIFVVLLVVFLIAMVSISPRMLCIITLSNDSIEYWRLFSQTQKYKYSYFPHIYISSYLHGRLQRKRYILFSSVRLPQEVLGQANKIHTSDKIVKIRYSKRTYQKLTEILPLEHRKKLEKAFCG